MGRQSAWTWWSVVGVSVALISCDGSTSEELGPADAGTATGGGGSGGSTTTPDAGSDAAPPSGPLEGLPSEPGAHIGQLEALGAGEWLDLGPPAADPDYGVARGRAWGGRSLILAPELRAAFFYGEGVHAFVKPDGRIMDDCFVYDINGHRWIAVYPGTDTTTFNQQVADGDLSIDDNAQVVDAEGHPVPIHTLVHAWDYLTYDTAGQRFVFHAGDGLGRYYLGGEDLIDEGVTALEAERETKTRPPMSPWFYDTVAGHFDRYPISAGAPDVGGFPGFLYLAPSHRIFLGGSAGVAMFDLATNEWSRVEDQGPRPPGYDHGIAYDPTRNLIFMGTGEADPTGGLYIFDVAGSTWTKPSSSGTAPESFRTNQASIFYDTTNDLVTVFHYGDGLVYTYEIDADSWSTAPIPDEVRSSISYPSHHAFYDPELNVYFLYMAGDSSDDGTMWAYRHP